MTATSKDLLDRLSGAGLAAADPAQVVPPCLPAPAATGRTLVVGAGKAAAVMARAVEDHWPVDRPPPTGQVVTRYGHAVRLDAITCVEAGHPVPDAAGCKAARQMLDAARDLGPDDRLIGLFSGGGSALLTLPAGAVTLADKQALTGALLRSGARISEINCVRKHLSAIKGGRLAAAAWPAQVFNLLISDVPGDDPAMVASGPLIPDATTCADARSVLSQYGIDPPERIRRHLQLESSETPKPNDSRLGTVETVFAARAQGSLEAMARTAREAGVTPVILGDSIEGEAREVARVMAGIARQVVRHGQPAAAPCVLLSGGETTVSVRGEGRGGRNAEFLLALAIALEGEPGVHALAVDSDGIDGSEDNAGARITPDTLARARSVGIDAKARLADNDGYGFFEALGDLVVTGPTLTNVNDLRAILILPANNPDTAGGRAR